MSLPEFLGRRLLQLVPTLLFILIVVFVLVRLLPGDPASAILGDRALDADVERINRELDGTIPVEDFRHRAIWNDDRARIEMHLEAMRDAAFEVDGRDFLIAAGETIHTDNSHKYGARDARILLRGGGWTPVKEWTDEEERFAVILAEAQAERVAP